MPKPPNGPPYSSPESFKGDGAADKAVFPDGYKTSGQHPPLASAIYSFEDFPNEITGPTLWHADEYRNNPEKWTHSFTHEEVRAIEEAADKFINSGLPLTAMTKDDFPLPSALSSLLTTLLHRTLLEGPGFFLFKNLLPTPPATAWSLQKSAVAYMGLGVHLGYPVSQNARGHLLGHVKDLGEDPTKTDRVRIYRTNARQYFHTDASDLVGLLCIAKAKEGGESDIVSTHRVWNVLRKEYPDVARCLTEDAWWFDRKGEVGPDHGQYYRGSVFYLVPDNDEAGVDGDGTRSGEGKKKKKMRVYLRFDPNNVTSLARFNSGLNAEIPPLTERQLHAIKILEEVCKRESLHMILDAGDIQLLANSHVLHARTAYTDYKPGTVDPKTGTERARRHLMRLWLSTPQAEGGWTTPYPDVGWKKRGGIQVGDNRPTCPFDAE